MATRKFQEGDKVVVNYKAWRDSYFVGHHGVIAGFVAPCYDVDFLIPGNGRKETRRIKAYKMDKAR